MKEFFGDRELAGIRRPDIEDFRSWRVKQKVKPATVNRTLSTVSYFFNWCKMREYVPGNPAFKVLLKVQNDRVVSLEAGEVNEMLQAADPYQKMWLMLGLFTGMRRGEILKARWEDIDFNAGVIRVEAANAKSKKSRVIHMPGNLIQYLKDLRLESPISGNIVLYQGNPVQEVKHSWQAFNKKLTFPKAKGLRFHDMRHIYATMLRRQGVPLDVLMELLGHASMKMVLRYAAYDPSVQEAHVNKITDFLAQTRAG
jgi:integrase